ncbi:MAG: metallopeptidase TldD-related protein [Myxococcota bacterium]
MRAKEEAFRILETALSVASQGVDDAEVALLGGQLGVSRFEERGVVSSTEQAAEMVSVRVLARGRIVQVSTSDFSREGIAEAAEEAKLRLSSLPPDPDPKSLPEPQNYAVVDAYDPETETTRALERAALASRAVLRAKERGLRTEGFVAVGRGGIDLSGQLSPYAVANTRGLLAYHPETRVTMHVDFRSSEERLGSARRSEVEVERIDADELVQAALDEHDGAPEPLVTAGGTYRALLQPAAVGELIRFLGMTAGAGLAESGASFLSDRIGQPVCSSKVTLRDDFTHPLHRGAPFDVEGVARKGVEIISNGIARSPVFAWENATRLATEPTGHRQVLPALGEFEGAVHLVMDGDHLSVGELLETLGTGVVIAGLESARLVESQNVRITSGTRGGIRLYEEGHPVALGPCMRLDGSVLKMLSSVVALGEPCWTRGGVVPALVLEQVTLRPIRSF